ncbi:MAG: hypothetical protein K2J48_05940, partial [Muribaculaceae bacterium]|nr:hypothetical protein [Muribaculaceae bacterium]
MKSILTTLLNNNNFKQPLIMKKSTLISIAALLSFCLNMAAGCGSSNNDEPKPAAGAVGVSLSPEELSAGPEASVLELSVKANADWAIRCDADWLTLRPSGGLKDTETKVQITLKANTSMDERSAAINIVSGGKDIKTVSLSQGYVMKATPSQSSLYMGGQESTASLSITANGDWSLSSEAEWITISPALY